MQRRQISQINLKLPVALIKDGNVYVAYTPALDVSTYGKTEHEAKKNFDELVRTYFEEFVDNPSALDQVLLSLGWKKHKDSWHPPKITNTIQNIEVSLAV